MTTTNEHTGDVTTRVDDYLSAWNERDAQRRDQLRFAWELVGPDGEIALRGLDVGELAADGRLQRITGFFGELPALKAA